MPATGPTGDSGDSGGSGARSGATGAGDPGSSPGGPAGGDPGTAGGEQLPHIARHAVADALLGTVTDRPAAAGFLALRRGLFVTVRTRRGELRGCRGTLWPEHDNLVDETWDNARSAALHDHRFPAVTAGELPDLLFEVSVLEEPVEIADDSALDPARYGVIVAAPDGRRGVLLPAIEHIASTAQQVEIARQKAGIDPGEPVVLSRFSVVKFEEE